MSKPIVSVVMVICDVERFLAEAIESILKQTFIDFEFIIVDFGSADQSKAIALSYARRDSRIRVHEVAHCGLAEARNTGCSLARGPYIAVMDADDVAHEERLTRQVDFMDKHPEVGVLGGAIEWIDATGRSLRIERFPTDDHEIRRGLPHSCLFCQPTVLIRKDIFLSVGGYRRAFALAEDYDLWFRMAERTGLANLEQVVLKYRSHPGQVQLSRVKQQSFYSLAAQASASARAKGGPDPLNSVELISPAVMASLGLTESAQRIRGDQDLIRSLYLAGQYARALQTASEALDSSYWQEARKWQIADMHLMLAKLYRKQGRFFSSVVSVARALAVRPVILGHPLKLWALRARSLAAAKMERRLASTNH